jgi:hypothetical protein
MCGSANNTLTLVGRMVIAQSRGCLARTQRAERVPTSRKPAGYLLTPARALRNLRTFEAFAEQQSGVSWLRAGAEYFWGPTQFGVVPASARGSCSTSSTPTAERLFTHRRLHQPSWRPSAAEPNALPFRQWVLRASGARIRGIP